MKFSASALTAALFFAASSTNISKSEAFGVVPTSAASSRNGVVRSGAFVPSRGSASSSFRSSSASTATASQLQMSYTVGIVGATGAVGKEIRSVLEERDFPVGRLRVFGSSRSAGRQVETDKYGAITVELFDVGAARECDVVFLAVSGDFALEHARALSEGEGGCVVIDNSVSFASHSVCNDCA